jgi:hypothetical protein
LLVLYKIIQLILYTVNKLYLVTKIASFVHNLDIFFCYNYRALCI